MINARLREFASQIESISCLCKISSIKTNAKAAFQKTLNYYQMCAGQKMPRQSLSK